MLNIVVSVLFNLIRIIGSILLVPLVVILKPFLAFFDFTAFTVYIVNFIDLGLTFMSFFITALNIPLAPLILFVSINLTMLTFTISVRGFLMIKSIWMAFRGNSGKTKIGFDTNQNK